MKVAQDLLDSLKGKKAGDTIAITYSRKKVEQQATLTLGALPKQEGEQGEPRAGIGVVPADMQSVKATKRINKYPLRLVRLAVPRRG